MGAIRRIGVLTSGGDAPGMNAALRAVVRAAVERGAGAIGFRRGYEGLIGGDTEALDVRGVGSIIQLGGTMLGSARCPAFRTDAGQLDALRRLSLCGVDGLVVIGGNGSQAGAHALAERGFPVVGVASTIDNDLPGADVSIGVDTALNVALEAIDRLKTTASSHQRAFLVEVMGRDCGYLALAAAIAGGAEVAVIPERPVDPAGIAQQIRDAYQRGKKHALVVVAEGVRWSEEARDRGAEGLLKRFAGRRDELGFELRATILGHVQRGGSPGAFDRLLASRLGAAAAHALMEGRTGVLVGMRRGEVAETPLAEVVRQKKVLDPSLFALAEVLAR